MTLPVQTGHQNVSAIVVDVDNTLLASGANTIAYLPIGALVIGGEITVTTVYGAAATLGIGDAGSATRYGSAVNINSAARTALTLTGYPVTAANAAVQITPSTISSAAGALRIVILYIVPKRENYAQG